MERSVLHVGHPILRTLAKPLSTQEIRSAWTQNLIETMRGIIDTCGVALAAPQVGVSVQLVVVEDRCRNPFNLPPERFVEQERSPVPFHVLINPVITKYDGPNVDYFEACHSVRDHLAVVRRSRCVEVECFDEAGSFRRIQATGWYARILQHEIDHLNGILYLDRMRSRTFSTMELYRQFWSERSVEETLSALEGTGGCPT